MKNIFKITSLIKTATLVTSISFLLILLVSCDPSLGMFKYDLPEANSKADETPPNAYFTVSETHDYLTYTFANGSTSATDYQWDFGDGNTSTDIDGINTYPDEGTYTVTLTASDKLGVTSTFSTTVEVVEPEVPLAIVPEIINGDFELTGDDKYLGWKMDKYSVGSSTPFGSSSDGESRDYEGVETDSKTRGAKWTGSQSAVPVTDNSRFAYQAITVSPNTEYILEYSYAITNEGDETIGEILDGHFGDSKDAVESEPLMKTVGAVASGKGNFTKNATRFTSNASGEVAIFIYVNSSADIWLDNVKVYPVE